jgi:hypothetical protein
MKLFGALALLLTFGGSFIVSAQGDAADNEQTTFQYQVGSAQRQAFHDLELR